MGAWRYVDLIGRVVAQLLSEKLHQQFIVDNRPGASGAIVDQMVAAAAPDGYTLQTAGSTHATNPSLYAEAKYDPVKDFTPIALVASTPYVLVVSPSLPVKSVAEFKSWAKKQPDAITFASAGNGSRQHLAAVMLMKLIDAKMVHVPYKGSGPAITDMLGGRLPVMFENVTVVVPHITSGKMRPLAVTTATRSSLLTDVPTLIETGFPGFEISGYFGVYGPPKLPSSIVGLLSGTINAALKTPEMQQNLARIGAEPVGGNPASFSASCKGTSIPGAKSFARQASPRINELSLPALRRTEPRDEANRVVNADRNARLRMQPGFALWVDLTSRLGMTPTNRAHEEDRMSGCLPMVAGLTLALLVADACAQSKSEAQRFPLRPIRIIVPTPAAGPTDFTARAIAQRMTETWGQQIIIDNRAGAGESLRTRSRRRRTPTATRSFSPLRRA